MVDRLPATLSSPSPIASSSAATSSGDIGDVISAGSTTKLNSLVPSNASKAASSRPSRRRGGYQTGFASRDPAVRSARQKYYDALKAAGIKKKPKPDSPVYIDGKLETEAFATRIKYFQEEINYMSSIKRTDHYNPTTYANQVTALKREKRDQAKYLQNPREKNKSTRS
ncbi:hypothetical protein [Pseudomonas syringae]|uniref:hypothetical protein n=1 Tax=Pseudomonas syringae TaxID=317 RepID=UPI0018E65CF1|nr:hypothetical protein [Pseudomonas syringae]MBI6818550.1 hypothetical protein [Pseudomonas syringae]MBI6821054.1 hypothetical protein [Pseudomonas syringae]